MSFTQSSVSLVKLFFISALFFLLGLDVVNAQSASGVKLIPAAIERPADPGDVFTERISITNVSGGEQTYFFGVRNISGVVNENQPIFAEEGAEKTGFELSSWVSLPTEPLTLAPGEEREFEITITVPDDATPGSHFGGVFAALEPPKLRTIGAGVGYQVGSIITIRISGDIVENARIREFSTDKLIYSFPNVNFVTLIDNSGNVLVRPRGFLEITNMLGKEVARLDVNDGLGGVFPGTKRSFENLWEGDGIGFGRYQAVVALVYGEEGRYSTIDASLSFWVLPLKIILPVLGVLALIILLLYISVRLHVRRTVRHLSTRGGQRVIRKRRRSNATSRLVLIAVSLLATVVVFLILLLVLFA